MKLTPLQRSALELAVEDSYGLWEICWRFAELLPDGSEGEVRRQARQTVGELVTLGLVVLTASSGGDANPDMTLRESEAAERIDDASSWVEPAAGAVQVRVVATKTGRDVYYSLPFQER